MGKLFDSNGYTIGWIDDKSGKITDENGYSKGYYDRSTGKITDEDGYLIGWYDKKTGKLTDENGYSKGYYDSSTGKITDGNGYLTGYSDKKVSNDNYVSSRNEEKHPYSNNTTRVNKEKASNSSRTDNVGLENYSGEGCFWEFVGFFLKLFIIDTYADIFKRKRNFKISDMIIFIIAFLTQYGFINWLRDNPKRCNWFFYTVNPSQTMINICLIISAIVAWSVVGFFRIHTSEHSLKEIIKYAVFSCVIAPIRMSFQYGIFILVCVIIIESTGKEDLYRMWNNR